MAKRLIDTELWNNEEIIENFTAEDKYFWLYLLTSPHNNICGVFKNSPTLIARDMGLHKDTIVNLLYRFEKVHNLIFADKETNEILILNWYKWNWTRSEDLMRTINKQMNEIKSKEILELLKERAFIVIGKKTVIRPSQDHTITNTITNTNIYNKIFDYWNSKKITIHKDRDCEKYIKGFQKAIKKYDEQSICLAIDRYAEIYHAEYYFNYKWDLDVFLSQKNCIPDFLDGGAKWENYKYWLEKNKKISQPKVDGSGYKIL